MHLSGLSRRTESARMSALAEAVLLAGTDLSMVLNEDDAGFPTIDYAAVHIKAITKRLLD